MRMVELILHPVRIRIVQAAMDGAAIRTSELCARMPDVSKATMYRHVALLVEGGLLKVVGEERVRGAVERSYRLEPTRAALNDDDVSAMSADDHRRGFAAAVTSLLAEFEIYLDQDGADPLADGVSYRQFILWLSQAEKARFIEEVFAAIRARSGQGPEPGRERHLLSTILFPAESTGRDA
jgi:DNA-binding transcriptional ArsR family regulator